MNFLSFFSVDDPFTLSSKLSSFPFNFYALLYSDSSCYLSLAALIAIRSESLTFFILIYHLAPIKTTRIKNTPRTTGIAIQLLDVSLIF
jgi:hypothetical protein